MPAIVDVEIILSEWRPESKFVGGDREQRRFLPYLGGVPVLTERLLLVVRDEAGSRRGFVAEDNIHIDGY